MTHLDREDDAQLRKRGLSNLALFEELCRDGLKSDAFKRVLSSAQSASWGILEEWLNGTCLPIGLADQARQITDSKEFRPTVWLYVNLDYRTGHKGSAALSRYEHEAQNWLLGPSTFPLGGPISRFLPVRASSYEWDRPSAWFSSLWSLQEAYLRPDMVFMNRFWEPLSESARTKWTLETLTALVMVMVRVLKTDPHGEFSRDRGRRAESEKARDEMPMGPAQLFNLLARMQISTRTHPSRAHILVQGNARHCTARRAEAIMSVLGVTEWFENATPGDAMILNMYPKAFVNEVRAKTGPDFFLARKTIGAPMSSKSYFFGLSRGSLLPFESLAPGKLCASQDVRMALYEAYDASFHSSVPTWTLLDTGSFIIKQAAILASSEAPSATGIEVLLTYRSTPGIDIYEDRVDINKWIKQQPKVYLTFAP